MPSLTGDVRAATQSRPNPGVFNFCIFFDPDWTPSPVQMCQDRRDMIGRALKARVGHFFREKSQLFVQIWISKRYSSVFGLSDP